MPLSVLGDDVSKYSIDPDAFSFTVDGVTFDQSNSTLFLEASADQSGNISEWDVVGGEGEYGFYTEFYGSAFEATDAFSVDDQLAAYQQVIQVARPRQTLFRP
ncbi:MAG: hypothetical protein ACRD4C_02860 [Candidatus Acidiferrales bacterium]